MSLRAAEILDQIDQQQALASVLRDCETFVRRHVVLSDDQAVAVALWFAHTHVLDCFDITPYLLVTSATKRCGKSRVLEIGAVLARDPWSTQRTSAAALVRKISRGVTLLLDESDQALRTEQEYVAALTGVLNSGFRRTGTASICVGVGTNISVVDLPTFGAKAIAGIGRVPDTVADRSIAIVIKRRHRGEPVERWRLREGAAAAAPLRQRLEAWARTATGLRDARPPLPDQLNDRAQDVWEPLLAIADAAAGDWPDRARRAAIALSGEVSEDDAIGVQLLADVRQVFADADDPAALSSKEIQTALVGMEDRPWATWTKGDKPITQHKIAGLLAEFEVVGGPMKLSGKTTRAYRRAAFEDAWARYLPDPERNPVTSPIDPALDRSFPGRNPEGDGYDLKTQETPIDPASGYEVTTRDPERAAGTGPAGEEEEDADGYF